MAERDLDERLLNYAVRVIKVVEALPNGVAGRRIRDQLLRSGTSVGAHYQEAQGAESRADFAHKLQIGLKEMRDPVYWLSLIERAELLPATRLAELIDEGKQLCAILSKSVATAKQQSNQKSSPSA